MTWKSLMLLYYPIYLPNFNVMKNLFTRKLLKISSLMIAIVFASYPGAFAQVITTDGNPADWAGFTTNFPGHSLISDTEPANASGNIDDQFTQGSKDEDLIQNWRWS